MTELSLILVEADEILFHCIEVTIPHWFLHLTAVVLCIIKLMSCHSCEALIKDIWALTTNETRLTNQHHSYVSTYGTAQRQLDTHICGAA